MLFSDIEIGKAGTTIYTIKEIAQGSDKYEYDAHTETVTVTAVDNGNGTLATTVTYDSDGALFTNALKEIPGGSISLTKQAIGATNANKNQLFNFTVNVYDELGNLATGSYDASIVSQSDRFGYTVLQPIEEVKYSHSPNITDEGIRSGGMGKSRRLKDVVTIPDAVQLSVSLRYGTYGNGSSYASVYVIPGNYEGAISSYSGSYGQIARLYGYNSSSPYYKTANYTVDGDTVTFGLYSGTSSYNTNSGSYGYGYYAVVTGYKEVTLYRNEETFSYTPGTAVSLAADDVLTINNLPQGFHYEIVETPVEGWELVSSTNTTGVVPSGQNAPQAVFRNVYSASGSAQIEATKVLTGGDIEDNLYEFELRNPNGELISTAYAKADGSITFDPIDYTLSDDGRTFAYYISEVAGEDPMITYDSSTKEVLVAVRDNGNGTMSADITYPADGMTFTNELHRNVQFSVSKTVRGNLANRAKYFDYTLTLLDQYGAPLSDEITAPEGVHNWTSPSTGVYHFKMQHDDSMTIEIPHGAQYTLVEDPVEYLAKYDRSVGGTNTNRNVESSIVTGTTDYTAGDISIAFTNSLTTVVPTGISDIPTLGILIAMGALAGIGVYFSLKKRRQRSNHST